MTPLTCQFDRSQPEPVAAAGRSWASRGAAGSTKTGDTEALRALLVMAETALPVRWGGGRRLFLLPRVPSDVATLPTRAGDRVSPLPVLRLMSTARRRGLGASQ